MVSLYVTKSAICLYEANINLAFHLLITGKVKKLQHLVSIFFGSIQWLKSCYTNGITFGSELLSGISIDITRCTLSHTIQYATDNDSNSEVLESNCHRFYLLHTESYDSMCNRKSTQTFLNLWQVTSKTCTVCKTVQ